ncbi:MAG TPA: hypothetical protein DEG17_01870 [Cyanobacteria bacterium UBA11149]|nr:hypothetical protein [Cyanobacteria bacterium UBA11366]HBR77224.1 hypothetical protein [Cyanobacteria bacterium UBA11159]HBS72258.1 hypothetical protein [Cyanobacteria bacterium UBA11153]HBW87656.1 hypothetical protein [Cyanobacteria bacterium UBA11149]HCA96660.1 hypothetical protein [Cyanobacteria bacterium UBA9226]
MPTTDTIPFPAPDQVKNNWNFLEVWVDPMQSPPYLLLLLGDKSGSCHIFDPAEQYKLVTSCETYERAQLWLLEDEYEPLEGRLLDVEVHGAA